MTPAIQRIAREEHPAAHWSPLLWSQCTEDELLIDLSEWSQTTGLPHGLPPNSACTSNLWTFLQSVPFAERHCSSPAHRIQRVLGSARAALERILVGSSSAATAPGSLARFSTPLRARSDAPAFTWHRLHVESLDGALLVTVGLDHDFCWHPAELCSPEKRLAPSRGRAGL